MTPRLKKLTQDDLKALDIDPSELRTYHMSCANCELDTFLEVPEWTSSTTLVTCCVCRTKNPIKMPADKATVKCPCCETETYVRHIIGEG